MILILAGFPSPVLIIREATLKVAILTSLKVRSGSQTVCQFIQCWFFLNVFSQWLQVSPNFATETTAFKNCPGAFKDKAAVDPKSTTWDVSRRFKSRSLPEIDRCWSIQLPVATYEAEAFLTANHKSTVHSYDHVSVITGSFTGILKLYIP